MLFRSNVIILLRRNETIRSMMTIFLIGDSQHREWDYWGSHRDGSLGRFGRTFSLAPFIVPLLSCDKLLVVK